MKYNGLKIGYVPYSDNFCAPGDRRRFVFYCNERNIKYTIANTNHIYDLVYLTYGCDIGAWVSYKKKNPSVKIIFELIDSYILEDVSVSMAFRGIVRYLMGFESKLYVNYKKALLEIISICDAVVCSTLIQKQEIIRINRNVHVSLDFFSDDILSYKKDYRAAKKIKLVWEGQPYTLKNMLLLNDVLKNFRCDVEIFVITDVVAKYYNGLRRVKTEDLLYGAEFDYKLIPWNRDSVSKIISECDLAIIPIISNDVFSWNKPENKLLFFWEIGIPVITSDTPAYRRVMDMAGVDCCCSTAEDWINKISYFIDSDERYKEDLAQQGNEYIEKYHQKEKILKNWDSILESV